MSTDERSEPTRTPDATDAERRDLLRRLAGVGAGVFATGWVLGSLRAAGQRPVATPRRQDTGITVPELHGPRVAGGVILIPAGPGRVRALDRRCTHLGCLVAPTADRRRLVCPCHGSVYDLAGSPLRGPAREALRPWRVRVERRGRIWVLGPA